MSKIPKFCSVKLYYALMRALESEILVLDFETTGSVRGYENLPWQIGLAVIRNGNVVPEAAFSSFLRVPEGHPFNPYAPGRWASLRNELMSAPSLVELWPRIGDRLKQFPICAHNASTERSIVNAAFPLQHFSWIDTLRICRQVFPNMTDYKLQSVIQAVGLESTVRQALPDGDYHDALFDATATAHLLCWLFKQPAWEGLQLEQLLL